MPRCVIFIQINLELIFPLLSLSKSLFLFLMIQKVFWQAISIVDRKQFFLALNLSTALLSFQREENERTTEIYTIFQITQNFPRFSLRRKQVGETSGNFHLSKKKKLYRSHQFLFLPCNIQWAMASDHLLTRGKIILE